MPTLFSLILHKLGHIQGISCAKRHNSAPLSNAGDPGGLTHNPQPETIENDKVYILVKLVSPCREKSPRASHLSAALSHFWNQLMM